MAIYGIDTGPLLRIINSMGQNAIERFAASNELFITDTVEQEIQIGNFS